MLRAIWCCRCQLHGLRHRTKDMRFEVWWILRTLAPIIKRANASEHRIENIGRRTQNFWSLVDEQAGRGRKYKRVIVDECAFALHLLDIREFRHPAHATGYGVAMPIFFSTPKGRNGFGTYGKLQQ